MLRDLQKKTYQLQQYFTELSNMDTVYLSGSPSKAPGGSTSNVNMPEFDKKKELISRIKP